MIALDNLVVMFDHLEPAIARYRELGFTVVPGGAHPGSTHVALVALADGVYLQLMAFTTPDPAHRWWRAKEQGGGFVGLCLYTDALVQTVAALEQAGVPMTAPTRGTRHRPDGYEVAWTIAFARPPLTTQMPVVIQDETPRDERVPAERVHANGVTGVAGISIATDDLARARIRWAAALAQPGEDVRLPEIDATGVRFRAGAHRIDVLVPASPASPVAAWLAERGPSPYALALRAPARTALDPRDLGARVTLEPG